MTVLLSLLWAAVAFLAAEVSDGYGARRQRGRQIATAVCALALFAAAIVLWEGGA